MSKICYSKNIWSFSILFLFKVSTVSKISIYLYNDEWTNGGPDKHPFGKNFLKIDIELKQYIFPLHAGL